MTVRETLAAAAARLAASSPTPRLDAELLMAHALGIPREAMLLDGLDREAPTGFEDLVSRREAREPIAYLVGRRAFWTIELEVGPGALVPRPDSETLIEAALAHFGPAGPATILDLGTGPGTLLLAALDQWPDARGVGIDRSRSALAYARRNADRLGLAGRADWRHGDWSSARAPADLILCNPPYVEEGAPLDLEVRGHEPAEALFAGADGLDAYRALAPLVPRLLLPGGIACIELGLGQAEAAIDLLAWPGCSVSLRRDLAGIERCLLLSVPRV